MIGTIQASELKLSFNVSVVVSININKNDSKGAIKFKISEPPAYFSQSPSCADRLLHPFSVFQVPMEYL